MSGGFHTCFSLNPRDDPELFSVLLYIKRFVSEASTCRSVDCYLVKLDTLVTSIEEYYPGVETTRRMLEKALACQEVRGALGPLAGYIDVVEELIMRDPRHTPLRRYADLVLTTLESITPSQKPLRIKRPPTYIIENIERETESPGLTTRGKKPPYTPGVKRVFEELRKITGRLKIQRVNTRKWITILLIVSLLVISILYIILLTKPTSIHLKYQILYI